MKRVMTIDEAVRWAYREELPKERAFSAGGPAGYPTGLGSKINRAISYWNLPSNGFGVIPDLSAAIGPCRDALMLHRAVLALDREIVVSIPPDWNPLQDFVDLGPEVDAAAYRALEHVLARTIDGSIVNRGKLSDAVRIAAILGAPECHVGAEKPVLQVHKRRGKVAWFRKVVRTEGTGATARSYEMEVDGMDRTARRPFPDAYVKYELDPDPAPIAADRAAYEIWRRTMDVLFEDLVGVLTEVDLCPCRLPDRPWEVAPAERAVLADLRRVSREGCSQPLAASISQVREKA